MIGKRSFPFKVVSFQRFILNFGGATFPGNLGPRKAPAYGLLFSSWAPYRSCQGIKGVSFSQHSCLKGRGCRFFLWKARVSWLFGVYLKLFTPVTFLSCFSKNWPIICVYNIHMFTSFTYKKKLS